MNGPTTVALALLLGATACPQQAGAGFADPSQSYEDPCLIACPAGDSVFMMVIRNSAGTPWLFDDVRLDFCDCPGIHLAPGMYDYSRGSSGCDIYKYPANDGTDGHVLFAVAGGGICGDSARVYCAGIAFPTRAVASPDQDGDLMVTEADLALIQMKIGSADPRADFDCDGAVTTADLAIAGAHLGHGIVATAVGWTGPPATLGFSRPPSPNPSRGHVEFTISIPDARTIVVTVHDLAGRRVATLWRGELPAGQHRFVWNGATDVGRHAGSGLYVVTARSPGTSVSESVILLR